MTKTLISLTALALSSANLAHAGSVLPPVPDTAIAAPMPDSGTDWSGLYFGGAVGIASGRIRSSAPAADDIAGNTLGGVFGGYNKQNGNLVFGGEIAYTATPIEFVTFGSTLENTVDLKARVGYAFGQAMVYGVAGYSFVTMNDVTDAADLSGFNFGAGLDYKFGSRYFVGVEYLARSVSGALQGNPAITFTDQVVSTVNLRAGISF